MVDKYFSILVDDIDIVLWTFLISFSFNKCNFGTYYMNEVSLELLKIRNLLHVQNIKIYFHYFVKFLWCKEERKLPLFVMI